MKLKHCFAIVFLACFVGATVAGNDKPQHEPAGPWLKTVEKYFHPAGPSTRTEWRKTEMGLVLKLELEQAKSGQQVIQGYSLQRLGNGTWGLQTHDQLVFIPLPTVETASKNSTRLKLKNQGVWKLEHFSAHVPAAPQAGVSQEDEPWVSLRLSRVLKKIN
jgi:hypothetical protein